jgi:hypothetical protein
MTAVVLHLSDIHIRSSKDLILKRAKSIAACTYAHLPEATHAFIVISGDIAYDGTTEQYELAEAFLNEIAADMGNQKKRPMHFVMCPGNHDCDFSLNTQVRQLTLEALATKEGDAIDESVVGACTAVQKPFFEFARKLNRDYASAEGDLLWQTLRYDVNGKDVLFDCINIAWMSRLREEQGTLNFPYKRYVRDRGDRPELRIAVMHHPFHWLSQRIYQPFRKALRAREHVVITGHEHIGNFGENTDTESGDSAYIEGCVLQGEKDLSDSAFNVVIFDLDRGMYRAIRYDWTGTIYEANEEGSWEDYRNIPVKARNPFDLEERFKQVLTDPGASFKRLSGQQLTLGDIFVFSDLISEDEAEEEKKITSSQILTDPNRIQGGVLLEGEERVGSTTLLYQLYERYYDRGFVPLYLRGGSVRGATHKDVDIWIKQAVEEQYGAQAGIRFEQTEKDKKILLLDNFNECLGSGAAHKARVLELVAERFERFIVVVGESFDLQEVLATVDDRMRRALKHYRILAFGYVLRAKLARKWFQLGAKDGSLDEASLLERCDQAEKLMDVVMVRNIVPSVPIYLLTVLQSIDAGLSGQFQESGLGAYYAFLINENLRAGGIPPAKWDELIEYSSDLAWHFHSEGGGELAKHSLREFNERFSAERHTIDFEKRLEELVAGRVLARTGDYLKFRYHYTYYLLKGRYITRNLAKPEMTGYLERCIKHLYVRDNANTVLFAAHHQAGQPLIMDKIIESLGELFKSKTPLKLAGDTNQIDDLVRELPRLEYAGGDPEGHRERINRLRDESEDGKDDGLADQEEKGPERSVIAQVVMVFKTVEILGQLLQNQFAALTRTRRVEVLENLFNAPLKALAGYFDFIAKKPDTILAEMDAMLRDRGKIKDPEKRQKIARELLAIIIQVIALGFIHKAASSVSSESLMDDVRAVAKKNDTPAFRLIELATKLDTLKRLPKEDIEKLARETEGELVSNRTLQLLILRHLYMFRTSEMDKQWLSGKKVVSIRTQKAIDIKSAKSKRLKK